jgi:drug/metabolite transporter (DMT)-like permease
MSAAVGLALVATLLWASSFIYIKIGLEDLPPLTFGALRYLIGAIALFAYRQARYGRMPPQVERDSAKWIVALGLVLYTFVPAVMFLGLNEVDAVTFNFVFQAGIPLVLALSAGLLVKEPTSGWEWVGVGLVVAGMYVFFPAVPEGNEALGIALAALAACGIGASNLLQRKILRNGKTAALDATLIPMALGSTVLLVIALAVESWPTFTAATVLLLLILGVVNTAFAFTIWHHAMRTLNALHAGVIASAQIVEVGVLAWLILDEELTADRIIGSLVVIGGIVIVHISRATAVRRQRGEPAATPRAEDHPVAGAQ